MSNSTQCSNLIDLGVLTKLITVWYNGAVRRPPNGVVGCVCVADISPFELKVKMLPEDYTLGVSALSKVTGTCTIDDDLLTWTGPPNPRSFDRWKVEVIDNSGAAPVVKHMLEMKLENS
jgi:hypothetical protein